MSFITIFNNPVVGISMNLEKQIWSVSMCVILFFKESYNSLAAPFVNDERGASVQVSWKVLSPDMGHDWFTIILSRSNITFNKCNIKLLLDKVLSLFVGTKIPTSKICNLINRMSYYEHERQIRLTCKIIVYGKYGMDGGRTLEDRPSVLSKSRFLNIDRQNRHSRS